MIKVGGRPILWYIMNHLKHHGMTEICVNLHYKPQQIIDYLGDSVMYSYEPELLGTAGALWKMSRWLGTEFVVVNGDTISDVDLTWMVDSHRKWRKVATVFTADTVSHNGGTFVFNDRIFNFISLEDFPLSLHKQVLPMLKQDDLVAEWWDGESVYFDCGTHEKLEKARKFFEG